MSAPASGVANCRTGIATSVECGPKAAFLPRGPGIAPPLRLPFARRDRYRYISQFDPASQRR